MTVNKRGIAKMMRDVQKEFDKHPIRIPIETNVPRVNGSAWGTPVEPGSTTIYNGPVIHGDANSAQLAWNNNGNVNQGHGGEQVAPGYEALAQALVSTLQGLPEVGLDDEELSDAQDTVNEALAEVTQPEPNARRVRRSVAALKGWLTPIATGLRTGAGNGAQEWAQTAIQQLGSAL